MPPFPYSFLIEDDLKEAKERGEEVGKIENGNKMFLESLKKWKITAKENDSDNRLKHKANILEAQAELLSAMDEGMSVNDSIRAAYEFRKRAYETRSTIIQTLSEFVAEGNDHSDIISQINDLNNRLSEEGIKKIAISEVIPDYEEEEEVK
jgi:phage terminase large subunit-like protein